MSSSFRRVAVLMGGLSSEREVSLVSGRECAGALSQLGYEVIKIDAGEDLVERLKETAPDACFNALHGRWGEDGCVQGILEWMRIPYTHSGVLASALAMDKILAKKIFALNGLQVAEDMLLPIEQISHAHPMPPPYVLKPVNEGSSVGIYMVSEKDSAPPSHKQLAELAEDKLMVERFVPGMELTVSVVGDKTLGVTEIIVPDGGFYDYEAKYTEAGSQHIIPARIPEEIARKTCEAALIAHRAIGCRGVSRSDFRYDDRHNLPVIIELNTQPGMTPTSLIPEQAASQGMEFTELVGWMMEDASCDR